MARAVAKAENSPIKYWVFQKTVFLFEKSPKFKFHYIVGKSANFLLASRPWTKNIFPGIADFVTGFEFSKFCSFTAT